MTNNKKRNQNECARCRLPLGGGDGRTSIKGKCIHISCLEREEMVAIFSKPL